MPKRPRTPDSGPEIVRILAVHYPYPSQANLEHIPEQADFVSWIVGCLGDQSLLHSIAWKPRTPSVVLIYVSREVENWRTILGEHKWAQVFLPGKVSDGDLHRHSRIFYSKYSNHRAAEKDGWKIKHITDAFVKKNVIEVCNSPYPQTTWCPAPELDKTNDSWVRPLPVEDFPDAPKPAAKPVVGSAAWASGNSRKANGSSARNGAAAPRGAWAKPPASVRSGAPTPPVAPNVWSSGIPKFNTLGSQYSRSAAVPASGSIAPTRSSASVNESTTVRSGSSVGSNAETIVEFFEDDDDLGSQISSVTDSLAETKLFSSEPKSTHPTTFVEQPNAADSIAENAWATEPDEKDDIRERAKCPAHQKLCNPNVCAIIELHCKSLGINYRDVKLGGPSNVYTIDRERQRAEEDKPPRRGGRGRGERGRRPNPASDRW